MNKIRAIVFCFVLLIAQFGFSQSTPPMENWGYQGDVPSFNNVSLFTAGEKNNSHSQLSVSVNPLDPKNIIATCVYNGMYSIVSNPNAVYSHVVYYHTTDYGASWLPSIADTQKNYLPKIARVSDSVLYNYYSSPSIVFRGKGLDSGSTSPKLVAVFAAGSSNHIKDTSNGIFVVTSDSINPKNTNSTSDWDLAHLYRLSEHCADAFPHKGFASQPTVAVDNSSSAHRGRVYVMWKEMQYDTAHTVINGSDTSSVSGLNFNKTKLRFAAIDMDSVVTTSAPNCDTYSSNSNIAFINSDVASNSTNIEINPGNIVVDEGGTVFISWLEYKSYEWNNYNTHGTRDVGCSIKLAFSTNGGSSFTQYSGTDLDTIRNAGSWAFADSTLESGAFYTDFASRLGGSFRSLSCSSTPNIAVKLDDYTGNEYIYVTWSEKGNIVPDSNKTHSEIKFAKIYFDSTGFSDSLEEHYVMNIKSDSIEHGTVDTLRYWPTISVNNGGSVNIAYCSAAVDSSDVNTCILNARLMGLGATPQVIQANGNSSKSFGSTIADSFSVAGAPAHPFVCAYSTFGLGILGIWAERTDTSAAHSQVLSAQANSLPNAIDGLTSYNNQRKIVFDGKRYHAVYHRLSPFVFNGHYDVMYAWGYTPDNWEDEYLLSGSGSAWSQIHRYPSLSLYKNGDTVRVGIVWEDDPLDGSSSSKGTISFASAYTTDGWKKNVIHWDAATPIAQHSNCSLEARPVIAQAVGDMSVIDAGNLPCVHGMDSIYTLGVTTGQANSEKGLNGWLISFAQQDGFLSTMSPNGYMSSDHTQVIAGIYTVMVDKDASTAHSSNRIISYGSYTHLVGGTYVTSYESGAIRSPSIMSAPYTSPSLASCESFNGNVSPISASAENANNYSNAAWLVWSEGNYLKNAVVPAYVKATYNTSTGQPASTYYLAVGLIGPDGNQFVMNNVSNKDTVIPVVSTNIAVKSGVGHGVPFVAWPSYNFWSLSHTQYGFTNDVSMRQMDDPFKWSGITTIFSDITWNSNVVAGHYGSFNHPSNTSNAYHPPVTTWFGGSPRTLHQSVNYALRGVIAEHLDWNAGGGTTPSIKYIRGKGPNTYNKYDPPAGTGYVTTGHFPIMTFQTYGQYCYVPVTYPTTTMHLSNALVESTSWYVGSYNNNVLPFAGLNTNGIIIAKQTDASWDPDSSNLVNYRGFVVQLDTFSLFRYTTGEFLVTTVDSIEHPIQFVSIPDTNTYYTRTAIQAVLKSDSFDVANGSLISFVHNISPSDTVEAYLKLAYGNSIDYIAELVADSGTIQLDSVNIQGADSISLITRTVCVENIDSTIVSGIGTCRGFIRIRAHLNFSDSSRSGSFDTTNFQLHNIFSNYSSRYDTSGLGKPISQGNKIGQAGVPTVANPIALKVYPNPVTPNVTIEFTISQEDAGEVAEVKVYNALSQEVTPLLSEEMAPGRHEITFDTTPLPSSAYWVSVRVHNHTDRKLIMLRR